MHLSSYPAYHVRFSCTNHSMASLISHGCFTTSSALIHQSGLNRTHVSKPLSTPTFLIKPSKTPSLKDISSKQGNLKETFQYSFDRDEFISFPDEAYAQLLELCASKKALSQGKQIHARIVKSYGVCNSPFLDTKLIFMYGKCGSLLDAENVFGKMSQRTIFAWNAVLGACVSNGDPLSVLKTYREMRLLGISLDARTFSCVVKACAALRDLNCGAEVHGLVIKFGYDSITFIVNSLVSMYAKGNNLDKARLLFDKMGEKEDVVLWNSMISAYSSNAQSLKALEFFGDMQKAGLVTNAYSYVGALQACENSLFIKPGMGIHAAILKANENINVYVANSLIAMYIRCGNMAEATGVFNVLGNKDSVSWNSMLAGFVQNGLYSEAIQFFYSLQGAGQKVDQVSLISVVAASGRLGNLLNGMEMHAYAIKHGFDSDLQVGNTLIDMYAKCSCVMYMDRAFHKMPDKDSISWTTVIAGCAKNGHHIQAFELFRQVQAEGIDVDILMIGSVLLACSGLKSVSQVKEIHGCVVRREISDLALENALVDTYGECGNIVYARKKFESILSKNVVSWTSMISCYVHNGLANEALELFHLMNQTSVVPDSIALVSALAATANLSTLNKGKEIHCFIIQRGFILEGSIVNSLVDMYARCGALEDASKVFNCAQSKNLVLWTNMINAYGLHGRGKDAVDFYHKMKDDGDSVPDHITFLALLYACSHSGLIDEGKRFLEIMRFEYQLEPWEEHYACVVDLLGRANHLEEAYNFIKSMQIKPTTPVWRALLGASWVHSNKRLGEIAARKLLELEPENPGNYVLISNVFASNGRWKDVEQIRMRMKGSGLKKTPGCSWIEVGNKMHTFVARDKSHPECDEIYEKLAHITEKLKREGGYVAETKFVVHNVQEEEKVQMLYGHSERLAIAYGLLKSPGETTIRITKNLRVCGDCHVFCKLVSRFFTRELVVRDANRFHHFENGVCSCGDFW